MLNNHVKTKYTVDPILSSQYLTFFSSIQIFAGLFVIANFNYLLFLSFSGAFSIIIAIGIFVTVFISRPNNDVSYFVFLGTACLFIVPLELLHTVSSSGMYTNLGNDANLTAQLWVLCRLVQSFSIFAGLFFVGRNLRLFKISFPYPYILLVLVLVGVFNWESFPACINEDLSPTTFKIVADRLVIIFIACSAGLLYWRRDEFFKSTYETLNLAILTFLCSEILFYSGNYYELYLFLYVCAYFFRIVSFYFIYKATVENCLEKPYEDILKDLQENEKTLNESQFIAKLGNYEQDLKTGEWHWSDGLYRIFGYERGEIACTTKQFWQFLHPDDRELAKSELEKYLALRKTEGLDLPVELDFRIVNSKQEIRDIQVVGAGVYDETGVPASHYGTFQDVTERKIAEEALRKAYDEMEQRVDERTRDLKEAHEQLQHAGKLSAVGQLSASIAHEFNNPLFGVVNVVKGIKRRVSLEKEDADLVEMAIKECERMKNLIRDLQDFNRPSSGKLALMDLHKTIDSILLLSKNKYKNKEIDVERKFMEGMPHIEAVADQIKQVLMNLLNNAADACEDEGLITIETRLSGEKVEIKIGDDGRGIKPEDLGHIFEPFFTTKSAIKGTGLGLSVSYGIIKKHGGEISVESQPGKGTVFSIILPIKGDYHEEKISPAG